MISQNTVSSGQQRGGREIRVKKVRFNGNLVGGASENLLDDPYNVVRIIVGVYNDTAIAPMTSAGATINTDVFKGCYGNLDSYLVKKLYDKYIPLQVTGNEKGGGDGYTPSVKNIRFTKVFKKGLLVKYPNDANQANPSRRLIVSMISDSGAVSNPGFATGYLTMEFEDA